MDRHVTAELRGLPSLCCSDSVDCVSGGAGNTGNKGTPRTTGALWCLHLHINEKLWCTLETTKLFQASGNRVHIKTC